MYAMKLRIFDRVLGSVVVNTVVFCVNQFPDRHKSKTTVFQC